MTTTSSTPPSDNASSSPATSGNQEFAGGAGDDRLSGGAGSDTVSGGEGDDVISGDGPVAGQWTYSFYDYDLKEGTAGQTRDFESGTLREQGYVDGLDVGALAARVRHSTSNQDDYGITYKSTLHVTDGGTYRFGTTSDDGSTIIIRDENGRTVDFRNDTGNTQSFMDNDYQQGATTRHGTTTLEGGHTYTIELRFWENWGAEVFRATVDGPDTGNVEQDLAHSPMLGVPPTLTGIGEEDGDDVIDAGAGSDTITTGGGHDVIEGGSFGGGPGTHDRVTDFDPANDTADMSGFYSRIDTLRANVQIVDGSAILTLPDGATVTFDHFSSVKSFTVANTLVPCFTPGASIATPYGPRAVETLRRGDMVLTDGHGPRPLAWIGRRDVTAKELEDAPNLRPILIRRGALGPDLPDRDIRVSPQHRILLSGYRTRLACGHAAAFAPAVTLLRGDTIVRCGALAPVRYLHLMFDRHEVVRANGIPTESLLPTARALGAFEAGARDEVLQIFPALRTAPEEGIFAPAHPVLKGKQARYIAAA